MEFGESLGYVLIGLLFIGVVALLYRKATKPRIQPGTGSVETPVVTPLSFAQLLVEAAEVAETLVAAAEQLYVDERLPKNERFDYVMKQLRVFFPQLDEERLRLTIEAAVYWLKIATATATSAPKKPPVRKAAPVP